MEVSLFEECIKAPTEWFNSKIHMWYGEPTTWATWKEVVWTEDCGLS
jgi:hypothetical protein